MTGFHLHEKIAQKQYKNLCAPCAPVPTIRDCVPINNLEIKVSGKCVVRPIQMENSEWQKLPYL